MGKEKMVKETIRGVEVREIGATWGSCKRGKESFGKGGTQQGQEEQSGGEEKRF